MKTKTKMPKPSRYIKKLAIITATVLTVLPIVFVISLKTFIDYSAKESVEKFLGNQGVKFDDENLEENIILATKAYHFRYLRGDEQNLWSALFPYQHLFSNQILPSFLRVKTGAIENLYLSGKCDSVARALAFALNHYALEAETFDMVDPKSLGHTVVSVDLDEKLNIILDPYYGFASSNGDSLITVDVAKTYALQESALKAWTPFNRNKAIPDIYKHFERVSYLNSSDNINIISNVDMTVNDVIRVGFTNGQPLARNDAINVGLNGLWDYIGHRYNRSFVRELNFTEKTKVTFFLLENLNEMFLTSSHVPIIEDNKLIFVIDKDESLIFRDGEAKRDWLKLKSYQFVDSIQFERVYN